MHRRAVARTDADHGHDCSVLCSDRRLMRSRPSGSFDGPGRTSAGSRDARPAGSPSRPHRAPAPWAGIAAMVRCDAPEPVPRISRCGSRSPAGSRSGTASRADPGPGGWHGLPPRVNSSAEYQRSSQWADKDRGKLVGADGRSSGNSRSSVATRNSTPACLRLASRRSEVLLASGPLLGRDMALDDGKDRFPDGSLDNRDPRRTRTGPGPHSAEPRTSLAIASSNAASVSGRILRSCSFVKRQAVRTLMSSNR